MAELLDSDGPAMTNQNTIGLYIGFTLELLVVIVMGEVAVGKDLAYVALIGLVYSWQFCIYHNEV